MPRKRASQHAGTHAERLQLAVRKLVLARGPLERIACERVRILVLLDESAGSGAERECQANAPQCTIDDRFGTDSSTLGWTPPSIDGFIRLSLDRLAMVSALQCSG